MADAEIDRLFIAIPELAFKPNLLSTALEKGIISRSQYDEIVQWRKANKHIMKTLDMAIEGEGIIGRLIAVAPELLSITTVDILRNIGAIDTTQAHALRLALRSGKALEGRPNDGMFSRITRLLGVQLSQERIDMWESLGWLAPREEGMTKDEWRAANRAVAERWRGYLTSGKLVAERVESAIRSKNVFDALLILGQIPMDESMVRAMVRSGIISPKMGNAYISAIRAGVRQWKVFEGARKAEGLRARFLLTLTGSLNSDMLLFLKRIGVISREQRAILEIAAQVSHRVNQKLLEDLTQRRFRVLPGEAPIKTFARASRESEGDILRLLAQAARESRREAKILAAKGSMRADQYNIQARSLHLSMRKMWEGIGYLSIWGESEVASAAAESVAAMQDKFLTPELRKALLWQAKAGVDSYISREENTLTLSRRVYKNMDLWQGRIDQRIKLGLLKGQSAEEIAREVQRFISPNVAGGVQYAARRLARTEINNAFHFTTIRNTRENPWVRGYKWNRSRSHGHLDECDRLATNDHDGLGPGVFKKNNVPGKPHPQCLCYLTVVQMSESEFIAASKAGRFKSWRKSVVEGGSAETYGKDVLARAVTGHIATHTLDLGAGALGRALR